MSTTDAFNQHVREVIAEAHGRVYYRRTGLPFDAANRQFIADVAEIAAGMDEYYEDAARTLKKAMETLETYIEADHLVDAGEFLLRDLGFTVDWTTDGYWIEKEA